MAGVWKGLSYKRYLYKDDVWWRKGGRFLEKEMSLFIYHVVICNYSVLNTLTRFTIPRSLKKQAHLSLSSLLYFSS